ncbi:sulfocyanin-like copper-binding protein [Pseudarthrobacter sp. L19]|uniref:sulfocyanin-like copper-binding protein n=1 Tax=Pseudarthrobacter sp. L19 TaxID=3423951 RepID=UPI003D7B7F2D
MSGLSPRGQNLAAAAAVVLLTVLSLLAVALLGNPAGPGGRPAGGCTVPALTGTQVNVTLTNMGGPVMRPRNGMMGGAMRLRADRGAVPHGTVSFLVTNAGNISHEMVILPCPTTRSPAPVRSGRTAPSTKAAASGRSPPAAAKAPARDSCPAPRAG